MKVRRVAFMDNTNFQTSFIPKKPLAEERVVVPRHTSLFSFISMLAFFVSLALAGGMYFYKDSLTKSVANMDASLIAARNTFEPALIQKLQVLDRRLTDSSQLLTSHIAVSPIFNALEINTLKSVQFTKFSYVTPTDPTAPIVVHMSGKARDYSSIALQSDQLSMNKNIHNPIFANLALDSTTGMVTFDLTFTVTSDLVRFANHLDDIISTPAPAASVTPATPTTPLATPAVPAATAAPATPTAPTSSIWNKVTGGASQ